MKPETRDNVIYLAVGISIAALVTADFFYADSHGMKDVAAVEIRFPCGDHIGPAGLPGHKGNAKAKSNVSADVWLRAIRDARPIGNFVRFSPSGE